MLHSVKIHAGIGIRAETSATQKVILDSVPDNLVSSVIITEHNDVKNSSVPTSRPDTTSYTPKEATEGDNLEYEVAPIDGLPARRTKAIRDMLDSRSFVLNVSDPSLYEEERNSMCGRRI